MLINLILTYIGNLHKISIGMVMKQVMVFASVMWNPRKWTLVLLLISGLLEFFQKQASAT